MSEDVTADYEGLPAAGRRNTATTFLLRRFARALAGAPVGFEVRLPDGRLQAFGRAAPAFRVLLNNRDGLRALASLDQLRFAEGYLAGDIAIEGDMLAPFALRGAFGDRHLLTSAWRFVQPLLFGQVSTNRAAISSHYDIDPAFFLSFLDPETPCYTQGVYQRDGETLADATRRKFAYCFEKLNLKPGDHVLEIGPGWGAWFEYASARGVRCTGLTISQASKDYLEARARALGQQWEIVFADLLSYRAERRYDAIVIMGVIEHLPQYDRVLAQFQSLLKPDGGIFLDGSACTRKYELSAFMVKYIYPGNHSFLVLHDFLEHLAKTPLRVAELFDDRHSYFLTFRQWARNLEANRAFVIDRFGEFNYRRFHLYLWGAAYEFLGRSLDCYRMVIR